MIELAVYDWCCWQGIDPFLRGSVVLRKEEGQGAQCLVYKASWQKGAGLVFEERCVVENGDYLVVVVNHPQVIGEIVGPANLDACYALQVDSREALFEANVMVGEHWWLVEMGVEGFFNGPACP